MIYIWKLNHPEVTLSLIGLQNPDGRGRAPRSFFWEEPVPVSSSVALCEVIKLPMPAVFVCTRYELMVIPVRWNVKVIRLLREMSLIAPCVNFPEHFSRLQTPHLIAPSWPNDGLRFHFLFCRLFFTSFRWPWTATVKIGLSGEAKQAFYIGGLGIKSGDLF